MKVPLRWLKDYIDLPSDIRVFTDKMTMIGHMLDKTIETENDTVIDLELRGNRADCYGIIGLAREAHACFGGRFDMPETIALPQAQGSARTVRVESAQVHRFYSVIIRNVRVGPSPAWMQTRLRDYGMEPINNIVDITNYVMIESGMPLHAFDLNRIGGNAIILRGAEEGETFVSFDGGTISLHPDDVVFSNTAGRVLGLVGIVGEKESGIHEDTTDILLECAAYDQATIRKTAFRHSILTEAALRHTHDLDGSLCDYALPRAAGLILEHAASNAATITEVSDIFPKKRKAPVIDFDPAEVARLGGVTVPVDEQTEILRRLWCAVDAPKDQRRLLVTPPLFRTDLKAPEDIVEEILRIWGYEKIPARALASPIPHPVEQKEVLLEEKSRDILASMGLDEIITVPLIDGSVADAVKDPLASRAIPVMNPPTANHNRMRTSLFIEHLDAARAMIARGDSIIAFYEVGKIYLKKDRPEHQPPHTPEFPYIERRVLSGLVSSKDNSWEYFRLKGIVEAYFEELGIRGIVFYKEEDATAGFPFSLSARAQQENLVLARLGLVDPVMIQRVFSISWPMHGFTIDIDNLAKAAVTPPSFMPYSMYPAVVMDISAAVPKTTSATQILQRARDSGGVLLRDVRIVDVYEKETARSLLIRCTYQSKDKTLQIDEAQEVHDKIADALRQIPGVSIAGRDSSAG